MRHAVIRTLFTHDARRTAEALALLTTYGELAKPLGVRRGGSRWEVIQPHLVIAHGATGLTPVRLSNGRIVAFRSRMGWGCT